MTEITSPSTKKLLSRFFAECIGTFFLALTILTLVNGERTEWTPFIVGSLIGLMIYLVGFVSGGHFNPSVTFGLVAARLISWKEGIVNICGQIVGALIGFWLGAKYFALEAQLPEPSGNEWAYELLGAFILSFAVGAVVRKKVSLALSGIVIGIALTIGIILSESVSGGVLNPAISLAGQMYSWHYILAPLIGGALAQYVYWGIVQE